MIINEHCEIGCGSTIDRGSLSNTIIGKNTYLDNQVHIAHNNKIGNNCIVAGQVGFAGSSSLGNNVMIGGQAGVITSRDRCWTKTVFPWSGFQSGIVKSCAF